MIDNHYHTAEPWAAAQLARHPSTATGSAGDVHVLGALVVVHFDDGRIRLYLRAGRSGRSRGPR